MIFPKKYKVLNVNEFYFDKYKIIPIRFEDRNMIMHWRNEQIYHLRQNKPLTTENQENYFNTVISKLFEQEQPKQILFSFLENNILIGYGGLVHLNWLDKNAEISFIMNTELEKKFFNKNWRMFLQLVEKVAFNQLDLKKTYIYAFDLRKHLYDTLLESNYFLDARLKSHCYFNNCYIDVVIHSKINNVSV